MTEQPPTKVFPGFWFAALLCLIVLAAQFLVVIPCTILGVVLKVPLTSHPATLIVANLFAFAVGALAGWLIGRAPPREWLPMAPGPFKLYLIATLTCCGAMVLSSEADNVLRRVVPMPADWQEMFKSLASIGTHPVLGFLLLAGVAPLTEEILFRGMILRGFKSRFTPAKAILACGFLFACLHMNPWQFFGALGLGVLFSWWRVCGASLWVCMWCHAVNNGALFFAGLLPWKIPGFTMEETEGTTNLQPWWLDLSGLLLVGIGVWLFWRHRPRPSPALPPPVPMPPALPPLGPPPLPTT